MPIEEFSRWVTEEGPNRDLALRRFDRIGKDVTKTEKLLAVVKHESKRSTKDLAFIHDAVEQRLPQRNLGGFIERQRVIQAELVYPLPLRPIVLRWKWRDLLRCRSDWSLPRGQRP